MSPEIGWKNKRKFQKYTLVYDSNHLSRKKINFGIAGHPLLRLKPQALISLRKYLLKINYFSCCSIQTIYDTFSLLECSMVVDQASNYANQKLYSKKKKKKSNSIWKLSFQKYRLMCSSRLEVVSTKCPWETGKSHGLRAMTWVTKLPEAGWPIKGYWHTEAESNDLAAQP